MWYRDVACVGGLIKFVEMEHRVTETTEVVPPEKPSDPRNKEVLYDSDLITLYKRKHVDIKPKTLRSENGWSAMTWTRELGSHCWIKGSIVDVDDILVDDSALSALQLNESAGSFTFKKMYSFCPILSTDGNDTLYLNSSRKFWDPSGWVVAVDLVAGPALDIGGRANGLGPRTEGAQHRMFVNQPSDQGSVRLLIS